MLMHNKSYVESMSEDHATQEEGLNYLDAAIRLVKEVDGWQVDTELQMFLDNRSTPLSVYSAPPLFVDFYEDWKGDLRYASIEAGFVENMSFRNIRAIARALYTSPTRRKYYLEFLESRRAGIKEGKDYKLPSFHDLELRYQYHLYVVDHEDIGVDVDKNYKEWCKSDECHTFLDVLEL